MSEKDLSSLFIDALNKVVSNKKELVYKIADILNLETESVYRRLAGTVKFTVYEMGLLTQAMNISLDSLLNQDTDIIPFFLQMKLNSKVPNINILRDLIDEFVVFLKSINSLKIEVRAVFSSLPIELYIFYPHLCKYMFFKWGHFYIATREFDQFSAWKIPESLIDVQNKLKECIKLLTNVLYFWDISLMLNLVNEINYHLLIGILTSEDAELIKKDLQNLLDNFEEFIKGKDKQIVPYKDIDFECYATNLSIGVTGCYVVAENSYLSVVNTSYLSSIIHYDPDTALKVGKWINSLKIISSLISGGCEKESVTFFRKQRQIVESIGDC